MSAGSAADPGLQGEEVAALGVGDAGRRLEALHLGGAGEPAEQDERLLGVSPGDEQGGQPGAGFAVVGDILEDPTEQRFGDGFVALEHGVAGLVHQAVDLGGEDLLHPLAHGRLGEGPRELGCRPSVAEGEHGGDALHPELGGEGLVVVHVHPDQFEGPLVVGGHLLENRAEHPAGVAPGRPEVHHHGDLVAALQHVLPEGLLIDVLDDHTDVRTRARRRIIPAGDTTGADATVLR